MKSLEAMISTLLAGCEAILEPVHITAEKWVVVSRTGAKTITVVDKPSSLASSWMKAQQRIRELPISALVKKAFEMDKVFADGRRTAGHWASLDGVLYYLLFLLLLLKQGYINRPYESSQFFSIVSPAFGFLTFKLQSIWQGCLE